VAILGDLSYESDETFNVTLSSPTSATIARAQGRGTIINDDRPSADLAVSQSAEGGPVTVGQELVLNLRITNSGPDPATGVRLLDTLPSGLRLVSASPSQGSCSAKGAGPLDCSIGTLASGSTATVRLTARATVSGTQTNRAEVNANESDPAPANNLSSFTIVVGSRGRP